MSSSQACGVSLNKSIASRAFSMDSGDAAANANLEWLKVGDVVSRASCIEDLSGDFREQTEHLHPVLFGTNLQLDLRVHVCHRTALGSSMMVVGTKRTWLYLAVVM